MISLLSVDWGGVLDKGEGEAWIDCNGLVAGHGMLWHGTLLFLGGTVTGVGLYERVGKTSGLFSRIYRKRMY